MIKDVHPVTGQFQKYRANMEHGVKRIRTDRELRGVVRQRLLGAGAGKPGKSYGKNLGVNGQED